jgi:hypothetical protein
VASYVLGLGWRRSAPGGTTVAGQRGLRIASGTTPGPIDRPGPHPLGPRRGSISVRIHRAGPVPGPPQPARPRGRGRQGDVAPVSRHGGAGTPGGCHRGARRIGPDGRPRGHRFPGHSSGQSCGRRAPAAGQAGRRRLALVGIDEGVCRSKVRSSSRLARCRPCALAAWCSGCRGLRGPRQPVPRARRSLRHGRLDSWSVMTTAAVLPGGGRRCFATSIPPCRLRPAAVFAVSSAPAVVLLVRSLMG